MRCKEILWSGGKVRKSVYMPLMTTSGQGLPSSSRDLPLSAASSMVLTLVLGRLLL